MGWRYLPELYEKDGMIELSMADVLGVKYCYRFGIDE